MSGSTISKPTPGRSPSRDCTGTIVIELLVLTTMLMLMGMLVPAIQKVREAADGLQPFHPIMAASMMDASDRAHERSEELNEILGARNLDPDALREFRNGFRRDQKRFESLLNQLGDATAKASNAKERLAIGNSMRSIREALQALATTEAKVTELIEKTSFSPGERTFLWGK